MRVRRERMQQHWNAQTYRAIEAENAREAIERASKPFAKPAAPARTCEPVSAEEKARAAQRALRGEFS